MTADRIQVSYSKKVSQQTGDGKFETMSLGGSVEFDVPDKVEWQEAYEGAYVTYKLIVDQLLDEAAPKPQVVEVQPKTIPGETIAPKTSTWTAPQPPQAVGNIEPIVEGVARAFTACKVFGVDVATTRNGKEWAKVRIGNREQIPGQYVSAKSFEPPIVNKLKALKEGDFIDVDGYFEPWKIDPNKYDLVVQRVEKVALVAQ